MRSRLRDVAQFRCNISKLRAVLATLRYTGDIARLGIGENMDRNVYPHLHRYIQIWNVRHEVAWMTGIIALQWLTVQHSH